MTQASKPTLRRTSVPGIYQFDCRKHAAIHHKVQFRVDGRQRWVVVHGSLSAARRERESARTSAENLTLGADRTFGDIASRYIERQQPFVTFSTHRAYQSVWALVKAQLGGIPLSKIDPDTVERVLGNLMSPDPRRRRMRQGYSTNTVRHVRAFLCAVTADAARRRKLLHDPLSGKTVRIPKVIVVPPSILTSEQLVRAWRSLGDDEFGRLLLALCGFMGLRRGEALAITPQEIDGLLPAWLRPEDRPTDLHVASVQRVVVNEATGIVVRNQTKTPGSSRVVPIPSLVLPAILSACEVRAPGESLLMSLDDPRRYLLDVVTDEWSKRCYTLAAAGMPKVGVQGLRHSYATLLADARTYDLVLKRLMGHTVPGMTGRYAHLTWTQLADARDDLDRYLNGREQGQHLPR